jgi:sterol desaturase/sphingolipid hydroxylase (fatty acid hydroxylase superfamily)
VHYVYEVLLSDARFDHNPDLQGPITRVFACGSYHLEHHRDPTRHFGLILTLWDHLLSTTTRHPSRQSSVSTPGNLHS